MTNTLPNNFPALPTETDQHKVLWFYRRYVEDFYREYRFGHFILAAYASVPALLTPDLLYKIWQNFHGYRWSNAPVSIHRIAVSDVLLSPLCREVGYELYEMHHDIRLAFMAWLKTESSTELWQNREMVAPEKIAAFTTEYHLKANPGQQRWGDGYHDLQRWSALAHGNLDQLQRALAKKLREAIVGDQKTVALRIMDVWSKTSQQLEKLTPPEQAGDIQKFKQNAHFLDAWKALLQEDPEMFAKIYKQNSKVENLLSNIEAGGIEVDIPGDKLTEIEELYPPTIWALVVAIDNYHPESDISALKGCVNDSKALREALEKISSKNNLRLEIKPLENENATRQAVEDGLDFFKQARNGDFCFFLFSGHVEHQSIEGNRGRRFLFHDSRVAGVANDLHQGELEEKIYPLLAEKSVHCLWIFDTHEAGADELKQGLFNLPLRKNAQTLKGSLVIMNAVQPGELAREQKNKLGKATGVFTENLLEVLAESGTSLSYRAIMERVKLRILQAKMDQTPFLETFPGFAANYLFLSNQLDSNISYKIAFDPEALEWRLNAGAQQGITPSLGFMNTFLRLKDDRQVLVGEVFPSHSTLLDFKADREKTFDAFLVQTALPKVKIAFDPKVVDSMRKSFLDAKNRYDLYYIDLVDNTSEAKYIIRCKNADSKAQPQDSFYLTRRTSEFEDPAAPELPVFTYVPEPFEFIKHLEYIAQWTGVLEYDHASEVVKKDSVKVSFESIEGVSYSEETLNDIKGTRQGYADALTLHYQKVNGEWVAPAFRSRVETNSPNDVYINALFLDSKYGILHLLKAGRLGKNATRTRSVGYANAEESFLQIGYLDGKYNAIPLNIGPEYLNQGTTEIQNYLKIFISNTPMDVQSFVQEELDFQAETKRSAGFYGRNSVDFSGVEWTSLVFPIKVVWKEEDVTEKNPEGKGLKNPAETAPPPTANIHPLQWHLKKTVIDGKTIDAHINVEEAWKTTMGKGVVIACIDDGVDSKHPEFKDKIVHPHNVTLGIDGADPQNKEEKHGTAGAGIACAIGVDSAGVAPAANLMPIKISSGLGSMAEAQAFARAADKGAGVIALIGGPEDGQWWNPGDSKHKKKTHLPNSTRLAFDYAVNKGRGGKGCVICIGAGNGNEEVANDGYASYTNAIVIGACNDQGLRSVYSDFGKNVWCCFPSNDFAWEPFKHPAPISQGIRTTDRTDKEGYGEGDYTNAFGGTAAAVYGVAGVVALMLAANPDLTWQEVKEIIKNSCTKIDPKNGQYDADGHSIYYGYGRIDAAEAVRSAVTFHISQATGNDPGDNNKSEQPEKKTPSTQERLVDRSLKIFLLNKDLPDAEVKSLTQTLFLPANSAFFIQENNEPRADYTLLCWAGMYYITKPNDWYRPVVMPIFIEEENAVQRLLAQLQHIAQWHFTLDLRKETDAKIPTDSLQVEIMDGQDLLTVKDGVLNVPLTGTRRSMDGSMDYSASISIRLINNGAQEIYIQPVLMMDYGCFVTIFSNSESTRPIEKGGRKDIEMNLNGVASKSLQLTLDTTTRLFNHQVGISTLKFIISLAPIDISKLELESLQMPEELLSTGRKRNEVSKSLFLDNQQILAFPDSGWNALDIEVRNNNPLFDKPNWDELNPYMAQETGDPYLSHFISGLYLETAADPSAKLTVRTEATELTKGGFLSNLLLNGANYWTSYRRNRRYKKMAKKYPELPKIVSVGDAWFQHPMLEDISYNIGNHFPTYSLAEAGNTSQNSFSIEEIFKAVREIKPAFVMLSSGIDDLMGDYLSSFLTPFDEGAEGEKPERFFASTFKAELDDICAIYRNVFDLFKTQQPGIQILVHGYDYPRPRPAAARTANWLGKFFDEKKILREGDRKAAMKYLIDEFNDRLQSVAKDYPTQVHFLDLRNLLRDNQWEDEMHPNNNGFQRLSTHFLKKISELLQRS